MGDFPRAEGLRACAEVRDLAYESGVVLDLREMTNLPAPGRGEALAEEMSGLLPDSGSRSSREPTLPSMASCARS